MAKSKFDIGDLEVIALNLGDEDVKAHLGDTLLYPLSKPIDDAVVTCASATYNGSNQVAQDITVTLSGVTLVEDTDYTVTQNTGGTNVGSYDVTVTGIGDYESTARGTFTINKVTPTVVAPTPKVLTYNGSAQELVNAGSTDFGTLKYKVGSDSWSTSVPTRTRSGSYELYYKVDGDSNVYDVPSASTTCSINEKQVTATVTLSQTTYTYNGSACQPTPTVKDGTTVIDPSEYTVTYSNNVNAGTATVTISDNVGGDYEVIGSTTFTINKADPTYTAPTAKSLTYNGSAQALLNGGSATGGTIYYSSDNSTWSTTIPSQTNAGTYTAYWKITGDSNHNDKASASISTTVSAKTVSSPTITLSQDSYVYNNTARQPSATVKDGTVTIASSEYTVSYSNNTNVGTATCTITDKTGGNYTVSGSKAFTITCASCTAPTAKSLTYNGSAQALVNAGSTSFGTMVYSTDNSSWSTSVPSGTNATSYTVYWKVTGNTNVCCTASSSVACSIAKAAMSYTAPKATTYTYDGNSKNLLSGASATGGSIQYSPNNSSWSTTIPTGINATTYTSYWKAVPDSNHSGGTSSASINTTIAKAATCGNAPTAKSLTYNGSAQALVNAGSSSCGTMQYATASTGTYSTTIPTQTNAGTYTTYWKVANDSNHSGTSSGSVSTTIAKAAMTYTAPSATTYTYANTARALMSGGTANGGSIQYSTSQTGTYTTTVPTQTNAGTYTTWWKAVPDSNHSGGTNAASVSTIIAKADQSAPTATGASVTYGNTATATASGGGGQGSLEWSNGSTLTGNTGSKTTSARWSGNGNYNASSYSNAVTLSITRANRTLSWTTAPSNIEIESTSTLLATPSAGSGDGSITYTSSNSNVATINGNTVSGRTTGSCTITATIAQGTNYNSASTSYTLNVTVVNYANHYLTFTATESGTFKFNKPTSESFSLKYSLDGGNTWVSLANRTNTPTVSAGNKIMWKSSLTTAFDYGVGSFSSSNRFTVEGNPLSLLYGDDFVGQTDLTGKDYPFMRLFSGCTGMTSAENLSLPATTLTTCCYGKMFYGCSGLTTVPQNMLPATTMVSSAYTNMFYGCSSLTTAPELPATTLADACYDGMFNGCRSLTTAPTLPAATMASSAYTHMFNDCSSLTTAPVLSAQTLAYACYEGMLNGCSSLTTAPTLPATTLAERCYCTMFARCTSLVTVPELPATTLASSCYSSMFQGCTSLTTLPVLSATTLASSCYDGMFYDCTSLTTIPSNYLPLMSLQPSCYGEMFRGCTSLVTVPSDLLPATYLAQGCYSYMFYDCTSLTTAPILPAKGLTKSCYVHMFQNCKKLNYIKAMFTTSPSSRYAGGWVSGVASSGTFVANSSAGWTTTMNCGNDTRPCGWTLRKESS